MAVSHCPNCGCSLQRYEPLEFGNVRVDGLSGIRFEGREVALARTQLSIVDALVRARGRYLTRDVLASVVGGNIYDRAICQYVRRARAAFREIDPEFDQIESLRGFSAYRWRFLPPPVSSAPAARREMRQSQHYFA